ncbi:MAG: agmatinase [Erysipelotrichaceae bacterium]|nr:agmatinase [Erysipelotrichaceae bacterium]
MKLTENIVTFVGCKSSYEDSDIVLFGAPFDSTTSYRPGTRFGPSAIRTESIGLETYSPYSDGDLTECKIFDSGDLVLPFGSAERALDEIYDRTKNIVNDGKIPFMLGGEHTVTFGAFRAIVEKYPDVHMIHFDAHTDLRDTYYGEYLSHATVIKRCYDLVGDKKIYHFGLRSGAKDEFVFAQEHNTIEKHSCKTLDKVLPLLKDKPVYITIDLDCMDPSFFPGTGTPESGGISFMDLLDSILKMSHLKVVGMDLNELSPMYDLSQASTALACKLTRESLIALTLNRQK